MFDKSKDYLLQFSPITIWYMQKVTEGDATFNTDSIAVFKAAAKELPYAKRESAHHSSPQFMEGEKLAVYVWREPWLAAGLSGVPQEGDKILADDRFYLVEEFDLTDYDDSGFHQRYSLRLIASKRTAVA